jgi:hypothetical protein
MPNMLFSRVHFILLNFYEVQSSEFLQKVTKETKSRSFRSGPSFPSLPSVKSDRMYGFGCGSARNLAGLPMNIVSSARNFMARERVYLDRFLKQRSALLKSEVSFDLPPPRGGLRNLSGRAVCSAAEFTSVFRTLIQGPTNS